MLLDDFLYRLAGPGNPAGNLTWPLDALMEGEPKRIALAVLALHFVPVDGSAIDTWWRAGLEPRYCKSNVLNHLSHLHRRCITRAASRNLRVGAQVNAAAQERPGRDDDGARTEAPAIARLDSGDLRATFGEEQICDHALRQLEQGKLFEQLADRAPVESAVALGAGSPNSGSLRAIQHAELDRGAIGGAAHQTAQGVDFAHDGTLRNAADGGIAGHLTNRVQHRCEEKRSGTQPGCHRCCFSTGVTTTHDDYVIVGHG